MGELLLNFKANCNDGIQYPERMERSWIVPF